MAQPRLVVLLLLFFLALWPLASDYVSHHPDERHYTDGAMQMLAAGEYWTPLKPDGTPRLRKPVLPYWLVAGSYRALGISPGASRLPFLLAGCALVWVTYELARLLTGSNSTATLAALIAMCNPLVILSATRSIPDILLCLFLLVSAYGFVGLLVKGSQQPRFYWAAYLGAALAFASKGLPALVFVAFAWAFALLMERNFSAWKKLWHAPGMAIAGMVASAWFVGVYWIHGTAALNVFWNDQVADRFVFDAVQSAWQFSLVWLVGAAVFLPWCVPALAASVVHKRDQPIDRPRTAYYWMTALWTLVLALSMALVIKFSTRYFMPVVPMWAVLLADVIERSRQSSVARWWRGMAIAMCAGWGMLAVGLSIADFQMGLPGLAVAVPISFAVVGVAAWWFGRLFGAHADRVRVAGLAILAIPIILLAVKPFVLPEQGERLAAILESRGLLGPATLQFVGKPALAAKIRVQSEGRAELDQVENPKRGFRPRHATVVVANVQEAARLDLDGYAARHFVTGIDRVKARDIWHALRAGRLQHYLAEHQKRVLFAEREAASTIDPTEWTASAGGGERTIYGERKLR